MRRLATIAALLALAAGGTATVADAYRGPTKKERAAITRAVKSSKLTAGVPDGSLRVTRIHVSTKGPYASSRLGGRGVPPARAVLRRTRGTWKLKTVGTASLGCGLPSAVRVDLELDCR